MELWEWIQLGLPTHPMLYSSGRIISFILEGNQLYAKTKLRAFHQPNCMYKQVHYFYDVTCQYIQCTDLQGCNVLCCRDFSTTSKSYVVGLRSTLNLPLALMDSTPLCLFPLRLMRYIYQFYVIYTCDCTLIYTFMYCVCQHTDPGMARIHRGLTV